MITVKGGTPRGSIDLCTSCKHSVIATLDDHTRLVKCSIFDMPIKRRVTECSEHLPKNRQSVNEMLHIAYILKLNPKTKAPMGFVKSQDLGEKELKKLEKQSWHWEDD